MTFRLFMFETCCLIQANLCLDALIHIHTQRPAFKEICYRDILYLASQWNAQGYYYKAFTAYRIVEVLRGDLGGYPEIFLHDFKDVDVRREKQICFRNLLRIFKLTQLLWSVLQSTWTKRFTDRNFSILYISFL